MFILAAALALIAAPAAAKPAARPVARPAAVIPLEPYVDNDHLAFRGRIGGVQGLFQFDTGGGITVITPPAAEAARCRPWGRLTGFRMRGDRIDAPRCDGIAITAAGARLAPATTLVVDFSKFLPKDAPPLLGSVGLDAFGKRPVTLDISGRRLIVETPASLKARIAHATEVPVQVVWEAEGYAPSVMAGLDTPSGRVWFTIDSGSDGAVIVGKHVAALFGLDPDKKGAQPFDGKLAGGVPLKATSHVADLILDGNIGAPVLRRWVVTFDVAHGRMWLAPVH
ncbi:hypothetical protein [Phenylobacterium sp.]|uniref:hypothetical protein n=1 Tax=Phenylobacterium sp. TaxID=1871053 RepID=UPI002F41A5AA